MDSLPKLSLEEAEYMAWMIESGSRWFTEKDLQVVASLSRKGLVVLESDYEGHNVLFASPKVAKLLTEGSK